MRIRSDERTRRLPTVILTSSEDQQDLVEGYGLGATATCANPWTWPNSARRWDSWVCTGWS
jgi:CheY-like chemotaxis protein